MELDFRRLLFRARTRDRAADGLADRLDLDNAFFHHRVWRQRLDRIVLHAVAITRSRQLEQLDGSRTDVDADERCLAFCDEPHDFSPCHGRLRALRAPRRSEEPTSELQSL